MYCAHHFLRNIKKFYFFVGGGWRRRHAPVSPLGSPVRSPQHRPKGEVFFSPSSVLIVKPHTLLCCCCWWKSWQTLHTWRRPSAARHMLVNPTPGGHLHPIPLVRPASQQSSVCIICFTSSRRPYLSPPSLLFPIQMCVLYINAFIRHKRRVGLLRTLWNTAAAALIYMEDHYTVKHHRSILKISINNRCRRP